MGGGSQTCLKNWKLLEYSALLGCSAGDAHAEIGILGGKTSMVGKPSSGSYGEPPLWVVCACSGDQSSLSCVSWELIRSVCLQKHGNNQRADKTFRPRVNVPVYRHGYPHAPKTQTHWIINKDWKVDGEIVKNLCSFSNLHVNVSNDYSIR